MVSRRKKKIVIPGLVLSFLFSSIAYSSDSIQALLFPVSLSINGERVENLYKPILNYNGDAYLPLRFIVEKTNGKVDYDSSTKNIDIEYQNTDPLKSEVTSLIKDENFHLLLNSEKKIYDSKEPINMWGTLRYIGEDEITITHGDPLLIYSIKDSNGNYEEMGIRTVLLEETFSPNNEYTSKPPLYLSESFNFQKSKMSSPEQFLQQTRKAWKLNPGEYTIGVRALFTQTSTNQNKELYTEIVIQVK
ncbi:stalk domain-containing protein [Paenibacillus naphthalenovorans]|uniref:stalk domain-containing protein n=1 Tax=Paenibacillus naphthalenovorans TaxID=162209 RepID=UPI000AC99E29|nr:stalk domain-containing protein [Paenibacillus naphthalenovorans]